MQPAIFQLLLTLGLGVLMWSAAHIFPFRKLAIRPEYRWDLLGLLASLGFVLVAGVLLDLAMNVLQSIPAVGRWRDVVRATPWWLVVPAYLLISDLGGYFTHRALHTPVLWPSHAWHHSPKHLNWIAGMRGSPMHVLVLLAPYFVAAILLPYTAPWFMVLGVTSLGIFNQHLIHSNLKIPFSRQLEWIFVTPRVHFVHHSPRQQLTDSNYGFIFSFWDRLFGTWTSPDSVPADEPLGLDYEAANWRMLLGLPSRVEKPRKAVVHGAS